MEKLDFDAGKTAIANIIDQSKNLQATVEVAKNLHDELVATNELYKDVAEQLSNTDAVIKSELNEKFGSLSLTLEQSISLKFTEKFSELSLRIKDLTDQNKDLEESINGLKNLIEEKDINYTSKLDKVFNELDELKSASKSLSNVIIFAIITAIGWVIFPLIFG